MKRIGRILQPLYLLFVISSFVASVLIALPFFLLSGLIKHPIARIFIYQWVHYWAKMWLFLIGMPLCKKGKFPNGRKYVIVANHISYLDTVNIYATIPSYFRTLARKEMVRIPVFGIIYKQLTILVDRSSPESRTKSMKLMWRLLKNECHIAIFPEGGFNETNQLLNTFYNGAFRLAVNTQTPILPVLFPDTQERWHYSGWWKIFPGKNRAIFLDPIGVEGLQEEALKELVYQKMETALRDYRMGKQ